MAPRKSVARRSNATTPARQTRAASSNRLTRASPGPSTSDVANPQLPEVQPQQSFAYGSTKTPLLPKALKVRSRMTAAEMAQELEGEIVVAEANLRAHVAEAIGDRHDAIEERNERARRRSESRVSRESSAISEHANLSREGPRSRRIGTADTADTTSALGQIEEGPEEVSGDVSEREEPLSDQESFEYSPSEEDSIELSYSEASATPEFPEWTYVREARHHETGIFDTILATPRRVREGSVRVARQTKDAATSMTVHILGVISQIVGAIGAPIRRIFAYCKYGYLEAQNYEYFNIFCYRAGQFFGILGYCLLGLAFLLFVLFAYVNTVPAIGHIRNLTPSSFTDLRDSLAILPKPVVVSDPVLAEQVKTVVETYNQRLLAIQERSSDILSQVRAITNLEQSLTEDRARLAGSFDQKYANLRHSVSREIGDRLKPLEQTISSWHNRIRDRYGQSANPAEVNYFSPGTGAVVDPYLTSPTKHKQFTLLQRVVLGMLGGLARYQSRPPTEALRSWEEQGDCWCSAVDSASFTQIVVLLGHAIFPEKIAVEHPLTGALTTPENTPRRMELWALDERKKDVDDELLGRGWTRIAAFKYVAPTTIHGPDGIQEFSVPAVMRPTNKLAIRVLDNYGGSVNCLYRVKVHGRPSKPHPVIG